MISPAKVKELEEQIEISGQQMDDLVKASQYSLADAIREGSSVTDQCVGNWVGPQDTMCALSAGLLALKARHLA